VLRERGSARPWSRRRVVLYRGLRNTGLRVAWPFEWPPPRTISIAALPGESGGGLPCERFLSLTFPTAQTWSAATSGRYWPAESPRPWRGSARSQRRSMWMPRNFSRATQETRSLVREWYMPSTARRWHRYPAFVLLVIGTTCLAVSTAAGLAGAGSESIAARRSAEPRWAYRRAMASVALQCPRASERTPPPVASPPSAGSPRTTSRSRLTPRIASWAARAAARNRRPGPRRGLCAHAPSPRWRTSHPAKPRGTVETRPCRDRAIEGRAPSVCHGGTVRVRRWLPSPALRVVPVIIYPLAGLGRAHGCPSLATCQARCSAASRSSRLACLTWRAMAFATAHPPATALC
jgi:hypothetical protein